MIMIKRKSKKKQWLNEKVKFNTGESQKSNSSYEK